MSAHRYCRCGTPLARDNTIGLCSVCQITRRRDRPPDVPAEFWRSDVMAAALASGDLGRVVRAYRCHPFHGQRLSQALLAGWLHMSQAAVCRIENGRRRVTIDEIAGIARTLGMPVALPWASQHEVGEDVDPLSRRSLLGAGAGAAFGLGATTAPAAAREIDPELVQHWTRLMMLLDDHDASFGPHGVLPAVRRELGLIAEHRQVARGVLRTGLLRVEARWSQFASWLGHDAGDERIADYWADRALRLARESGYQDLVAYVLVRQSRWAGDGPDARRAMTLAEAASGTPGTSDQIRALCTLQEARSHALGHDADACERSLADAHRLLERADAAATPGLVGSDLSAPYVLAAEARCGLALRPRRAISMFEEAVRRWPADHRRSRGIQQAHLALACAAAGEPERAAAEGMTALATARTTGSDIAMRTLTRLDRRLAGCDTPEAADFREALATV